MDVLAALVGVTTGLAVSPHFDNPYKSTSGRRTPAAAWCAVWQAGQACLLAAQPSLGPIPPFRTWLLLLLPRSGKFLERKVEFNSFKRFESIRVRPNYGGWVLPLPPPSLPPLLVASPLLVCNVIQLGDGSSSPHLTSRPTRTCAAGRLVRRPGAPTPFSRTRRTVGVLTVFLVSGIMHEALFWWGHAPPLLPRLPLLLLPLRVSA